MNEIFQFKYGNIKEIKIHLWKIARVYSNTECLKILNDMKWNRKRKIKSF